VLWKRSKNYTSSIALRSLRFDWLPAEAVAYHRDPRKVGQTKWNYWKLWNFALEGSRLYDRPTEGCYVLESHDSFRGLCIGALDCLQDFGAR